VKRVDLKTNEGMLILDFNFVSTPLPALTARGGRIITAPRESR
jgi:hypothetical protein